MKRSASDAELDAPDQGVAEPAAGAAGAAEDADDLDLEAELERELAQAEDGHDTADGHDPPVPGPDAGTDRQPDQSLAERQPETEPAGPAPPAAAAAGSDDEDEEASRLERARKNQEILKLLTPEQLDRYEAYRRSSLSKRNMKRLLQSVANQAPHPNSTIVMCGIAKMFVGELVEAGASPCPCPLCPADPALASEQGDTGPLRPAHIHAAFHQLGGQGKVPQRVRGRHRRL